MERTSQGLAGLTVAQAILGTLGVCLIESGVDSVSAVFYRCVFGGCVLVAYCIWRNDLISMRGLPRRELLMAILSAALMTTNWVLIFEGIRLTSIAVATIVFHVQPFFVVLIGAFALKESVPAIVFGWIALALIGLTLASGVSIAEFGVDKSYLIGLSVTIGAALSYALVTVIAKELKAIKSHQLTLVQCIFGGLMLGAIVPGNLVNISIQQWGWLLLMGTVHTGLVYILLYASLPKLTTPSIAVLLFIYPGSAILVDGWVYDHHISMVQAAGLATIIVASLGVTLKWGQRPIIH